MKVCSKCGEEKPLSSYTKAPNYKDGYKGQCKSCRRDYYYENKQRILTQQREKVTGWTGEQFEEAWVKQRGRCAVCEVPMAKSGNKHNSVTADHCHNTGDTRGLLCSSCNVGLGKFFDDTESLYKAIDYLNSFSR